MGQGIIELAFEETGNDCVRLCKATARIGLFALAAASAGFQGLLRELEKSYREAKDTPLLKSGAGAIAEGFFEDATNAGPKRSLLPATISSLLRNSSVEASSSESIADFFTLTFENVAT